MSGASLCGASPAVHKYLSRYAEAAAALPAGAFDQVLIIPSYGEGELSRVFDGLPLSRSLLVVLVLNAREDSPPWVHAQNERTVAWLRGRYAFCRDRGFAHPRAWVWVVDRASPGKRWGRRGGVGLARKLGADLALRLVHAGRLRTRFLCFTDADASLPADYFARVDGLPDVAAAVFPFVHAVEEPGADDAYLWAYDIWLRYYVKGLAWAGSPYAFHTIGSTMVVGAAAYAQVRGVPARQAGEDFHLLNKLAKVGEVVSLPGAPIRLSGRRSARVPFGTGAAIARAAERGVDAARWPLYHPDSFALLRIALRALRDAARAREPDFAAQLSAAMAHTAHEGILGPMVDALTQEGVFLAHERALATTRSGAAAVRHAQHYFDALRTLKVIHHLREAALPELPLREALARAAFVAVDARAALADVSAALADR